MAGTLTYYWCVCEMICLLSGISVSLVHIFNFTTYASVFSKVVNNL